MKTLKDFFRKETVFCVSFLLALISAAAVRPDPAYLTYPDYRTLALLFCFMIIVAGFQWLGVFSLLGETLLKKASSLRNLSVLMVLLCFFSSMIITNDVTLITFVPFTILVYQMIGREDRILRIVVLETIAANLGSMATPIGNPQNLYLYSMSGVTLGEFVRAVLPYAGLSLILLVCILFTEKNEALESISVKRTEGSPDRKSPSPASGICCPALTVSSGSIPDFSIYSCADLCGRGCAGSEPEIVRKGGLFSSADLSVFLYFYREYEADPGDQQRSGVPCPGKGTVGGNPYQPGYQ